MKTKWKEKEKKEEKKRKEAKRKRYHPDANSGPSVYRATALPLGHVEHTRDVWEFLLLKPLSLIKHEFKDNLSEEWLQFGQWKPNVNAFHRIYM